MLSNLRLRVPICCSTILVLAGCGGGGGGTGGSTSPAQPALTLGVPSNVTVAPGLSFFVTITAVETGTTATPTVSLGALPAGVTTSSTFPISVPSAGVNLFFSTSSAIAAGSVAIPITGTAGTATATSSIPLTVVTAPLEPETFSMPPFLHEVNITQGGTYEFKSSLSGTIGAPLYSVSMSVTGLPTGVTGSVIPQILQPGSLFTVTLNAGSSAPLTQNIPWRIVATPSANIAPQIASLLLNVVPAAGGVGWTNQTSYVSTRATPLSAVYDSAHQMVYSSNQVWNRVEIISYQTRAIVKTLSIRSPRGVDLSIDGKTVWVATGSQGMYAIDTATFKATRYQLPGFNASLGNRGGSWEGEQVLALADGTVMIKTSINAQGNNRAALIWNPLDGSLTQFKFPDGRDANFELLTRSGDGKRIFGIEDWGDSYWYDVLTKQFSPVISLTDSWRPYQLRATFDGSRVAISGATGFYLYDGNLEPDRAIARWRIHSFSLDKWNLRRLCLQS